MKPETGLFKSRDLYEFYKGWHNTAIKHYRECCQVSNIRDYQRSELFMHKTAALCDLWLRISRIYEH